MKLLNIPAVALAFSLIFITGSAHNYSVPKIEGGQQALSVFEGKKLLVITLPVIQNASSDSLLYSLDTLAAARSQFLQVIAVPSFEDGYTPSQKTALEQWYRSKLGPHILITEGLYTRKTSGIQQHLLFKWLTDVTQNGVFDIDVEGPGYKFFAKENGQLYSVLRPQSRIGGQGVQKTLLIQ